MRSSTDDLVWIYDLPEHVISKIFTYFTTHNLVTTTLINTRWNTAAPNYWPELILPHRTPDKTKAKLITRSAASLKSIHFKFYFDYLLAFKSLSACSRLKHLTIGEGGLTWIAGATASSEQSSENKLNGSNGVQTCTSNNSNNNNNNNNNNNSQSNHNQENGNNNQEPPMFEDTHAKALVSTAINAANASAEAANRANIAINSASVNIFSAQTAYVNAAALLRALAPSSNSSALQEALTAVGRAVEAADKAVEAAAISAHGAASAANAASVASGMAGHVLRYHNTTYVVGSSNSSSSTPSTEAAQQNLRASHIKTLRITSGRSDKKVIPEYKHLQLFSNLRSLSLDGGISPPHLKNVILAARNLKSLKINCSDAGEELQSLQFAVSLASLSLQYFNQSFVPAVCKIPSLTSLRLQYTNHSPQIGMELIASSLPRIRSFFLRHPTFTIPSSTTANDSELGFLRKLTELIELELRLPNCDPEVLGGLTLTTLRKLGTSMVLPVSFVQQQPNLTHISLYVNQTPAYPKTLIPSPEKLTQITTLSLDGINISEPIIAILAQMNLIKLSIACEEISSSDLTSLFSSLSPTLAYLDLLVGFDVEPTAKLAYSLPKPNPHLVISVAKRS